MLYDGDGGRLQLIFKLPEEKKSLYNHFFLKKKKKEKNFFPRIIFIWNKWSQDETEVEGIGLHKKG